MEEKKTKIGPIMLSMIAILILVIGGTYAWFSLRLNGTKVNVLKAGTLSLILDDENSMGINEDKAVPMLDEIGELLDPYHFTLTNEGTELTEYTIYFDDEELDENDERINDDKVKYNLVKDSTSRTALLATIAENPNRILDTGIIKGGQTITYDLRLWIDENASNEVMGQIVKGKLRVVATQVKKVVLNEESLNMTIIGTNEINLSESIPVSDEVGVTLEPYYFSLKNTANETSKYTVIIEETALMSVRQASISDEKIKYQLIKNDEEIALSILSETVIGEEKVLDTGEIEAGETNTYELRMWIDESVGEEEIQDYSFHANLRIKAQETQLPRNENILNIYRYDATSCLTGEESTCIEIASSQTYETGTIIKYKVNDEEEKYFHVMFDNGDTLTLQQREDTITAIKWYDTGSVNGDNSKGPLTALSKLEDTTSSWTNVNNIVYEAGTTIFKDNAFTGCNIKSDTTECITNTYTLPERTSKARMITVQEAASFGCKSQAQTCPAWMNNYLYNSTKFGGTVDKINNGYWTMSASVSYPNAAVQIYYNGSLNLYNGSALITTSRCGARAVVVIDK